MIDVSHIEPAELLRLLYNAIDMGARIGFPTFPEPMTLDEARTLVAERMRDGVARFDYLNGRPLKVAIGPAQVDERLYDREHGPGAFAVAIGAEYVKKDERLFFRLDGEKLVPCEDYGEAYRAPKQCDFGSRMADFLLSKRERRRRSRRRPRSKRMLGIPPERPFVEVVRSIEVVTFVAHRFGVAAQVEDRRLPREMWSEIRRFATVYVEHGKRVPDSVRLELDGMLKRSAYDAARKLYEQVEARR